MRPFGEYDRLILRRCRIQMTLFPNNRYKKTRLSVNVCVDWGTSIVAAWNTCLNNMTPPVQKTTKLWSGSHVQRKLRSGQPTCVELIHHSRESPDERIESFTGVCSFIPGGALNTTPHLDIFLSISRPFLSIVIHFSRSAIFWSSATKHAIFRSD